MRSFSNIFVCSCLICAKGGEWSLTSPTFAVVNDVAHVAKSLPRLPTDPKVIMILKREGSRSKKKLRFRPAKVNAAVQWLMRNNPHYIDAISKGDLKYEPLPLPPGADKDAFQDVPAQFALTEEENDDVCEALKAGSSEAEHTAEGDITLLFTEPPLMSREEHIRLNMGVPSDRTFKDDVDVGLFPLSPSLSPPAPLRVPPAASPFSKDDGQVPPPVLQPPPVSNSPALDPRLRAMFAGMGANQEANQDPLDRPVVSKDPPVPFDIDSLFPGVDLNRSVYKDDHGTTAPVVSAACRL